MARSFAEEHVERLETLIKENVGVDMVTVGNTSVKYVNLVHQYDFWKSKLARENNTRPRAAKINLSNF